MFDGIQAPYFHGVGYIRFNVDGMEYRMTGNHMFKGSSMYNKTHPQRRAMNESARGSDIVVSGHWHEKALYQQAFQEFGGQSNLVTMAALGTYKSSDEYVRTYGMNCQDPQMMYGVAMRLDKDKKYVLPEYDILEAIKHFK